MRLNSGKYEGKLAEALMIRHADYVNWSLQNHPNRMLVNHLTDLVGKLDSRPFVVQCDAPDCEQIATRASAYQNTSSLMFWCDDCDPYGAGANRGKLTIVRTFSDAIRHVELTCSSGHMSEKRSVVRALAEAKGAPTRLTERAALAFFA